MGDIKLLAISFYSNKWDLNNFYWFSLLPLKCYIFSVHRVCLMKQVLFEEMVVLTVRRSVLLNFVGKIC